MTENGEAHVTDARAEDETATARLARWAVELRYRDIPPEVAHAAKRAIVDVTGCALAARGEGVVEALIALGDEAGGRAEASVLGYSQRFSAQWAAFVNVTLAHALDYDDTTERVNGHPSASLVPAALAVGEAARAPGEAIVAAYVAGLEVMGRIGQVVNPAHYDRGWHSSSTLGALGTAVVAGRLLGLETVQLRHALGIAASFSSGLKKNFGTDTKPLQVGAAARNGILAAQLAAVGVDADPSIFDGPMSFCRVAGEPDGQLAPAGLDSLGQTWHAARPGLSFKRFPACYSTHRAVNAVLELVEAHDVRPEQVERIECGTNYSAVEKLVYDRPTTPLAAKFSMHYTTAVAVLDRRLGLPQFLEERVSREDVQSLLTRVEMFVHPELRTAAQLRACDFAEVTLRLKDGRVLTQRVIDPPGNARRPLSDGEIATKYLENAGLALDADAAERSLALLRSLEMVGSIREVVRVLTPAAPARAS
ncbi:MAG: MmgE/PrpD family protein [Chloroflexi bacterium]|nr:MmgE/PrpD family protein [Chloroflexota bacterium]